MRRLQAKMNIVQSPPLRHCRQPMVLGPMLERQYYGKRQLFTSQRDRHSFNKKLKESQQTHHMRSQQKKENLVSCASATDQGSSSFQKLAPLSGFKAMNLSQMSQDPNFIATVCTDDSNLPKVRPSTNHEPKGQRRSMHDQIASGEDNQGLSAISSSSQSSEPEEPVSNTQDLWAPTNMDQVSCN